MGNVLFYVSVMFNVIIFGSLLLVVLLKGPKWVMKKIKTVLSKREVTNASTYEKRVDFFERLSDTSNKGKMVFLGDSLTGNGIWEEIFDSAYILNRGISGDTTSGVLKRLDHITLLKPSKLFIMIGINDFQMGKSTNEILENYKLILDTIQEKTPNTEIFVHSILPINNGMNASAVDASTIIEFNEELRLLAEGLNVKYVDLHSEFVDENNHLDKKYTFDGLHINGEGYLVWKHNIEKFVNKKDLKEA